MHNAVQHLARRMAILGGVVLGALVLLVCVSVLGRVLNTVLHGDWWQSVAPGFADDLIRLGIGPITGDFELVETGIAFAIFAFLPYAQTSGAHAEVDLLVERFSPWVRRLLRTLSDCIFAFALILITWRLYDGMLAKMRYGETTFLLQFPLWWAYGASFLGAVIAALTGIWVAVARCLAFFRSQDVLPGSAEGDH